MSMEIYESFIREARVIDGEDGYPFWRWYIKPVPCVPLKTRWVVL